MKKEKRIDRCWTNNFEKYLKVSVQDEPYNVDGYFLYKSQRVLCEFKSQKYDLNDLYTLTRIFCQSIFYVRRFYENKHTLPTTIFIGTSDKYIIIPITSLILPYILNKLYDWSISPSAAMNYHEMINDILTDKKLVISGKFFIAWYRVNNSVSDTMKHIKELIGQREYENMNVQSCFYSVNNHQSCKEAVLEYKKNQNDDILNKVEQFLNQKTFEDGERKKSRKLATQHYHTPFQLCEKMIKKTFSFSIDAISESIRIHNLEWMFPADKLGIVDKNQIYYTSDNTPKIQLGQYVWPSSHYKNENYLESEDDMNYDKIFGNPPFQEVDENGYSIAPRGVKLWEKFLIRDLDKLKDNGLLCYVTPPWSNRLFEYIKQKYCVCYVNIGGAKKYFPKVNSKFNWYIIKKSPPISDTIIEWENEGKVTTVNLSTINCLPDKFDYFTLSTKLKEKFSNEISHFNFVRVQTHAIKPYTKKQKEMAKKTPWHVLDLETKEYKWPNKHTSSDNWGCTYWSNKKHSVQDKKKVIVSYTGYLKPFYDEGKFGTSPHSFFKIVESEEEGKLVTKLLSSRLYEIFIKLNKTNGFNELKLIRNLPYPKIKNDFTDRDLYEYFNLSSKEIELIENINNNDSMPDEIVIDEHDRIHTKDAIKTRGEVFTPVSLVKKIIDKADEVNSNDNFITESITDTACGNGNFLIELLTRKIIGSMSHVDALKTIRGVDIDEINVNECRERLSLGKKDKEIWDILNHNVICADSLDRTHIGWKIVGYMWNDKPEITIDDFCVYE